MMTRVFAVVAGLALGLAAAGSAWAAGKPQSVTVTLDSSMTLNGKSIAPGEYKFTWVDSGQKVDVTVKRGGKVVAESAATVEESAKPSASAGVVSHKDESGNVVIERLELRGKKALVFPAS